MTVGMIIFGLVAAVLYFLGSRQRLDAAAATPRAVKRQVFRAAKAKSVFLGNSQGAPVFESAQNLRYTLIIGESGGGKTTGLRTRMRNEVELARSSGLTLRIVLSPFRSDSGLERYAFELAEEFDLPWYVVNEGEGAASSFEVVAEMAHAYTTKRSLSHALATAVSGIPDPRVEFFFDVAQSQLEKVLAERPECRTAREIGAALSDPSLYESARHFEHSLGLRLRWGRLCEPDSWNRRPEDLTAAQRSSALTMGQYMETGGIIYVRSAPEFPAIASYLERTAFSSLVKLHESGSPTGTTLFIRDEHPVLSALGPGMDTSETLINRGRAYGCRLINICQGLGMYHHGRSGGDAYVRTLLQGAAVVFMGSNDGGYSADLLGSEWSHEWFIEIPKLFQNEVLSHHQMPLLRQKDLFALSLGNHKPPRALLRIPRAERVAPYLYVECPYPQSLEEVERQEQLGAVTDWPGCVQQTAHEFFQAPELPNPTDVLGAFTAEGNPP